MNIQPSSPRRQRTQTNSSNLGGSGWKEKGSATSLANPSASARDARSSDPLFFVKLVRDFVASHEEASSLNRAMDLLAEAVEQLGFLRVIYSRMPATRLADGKWAPPPLICRNLPPRSERQRPRHSPNDPYCHACFENNLNVEWATIQGRDSLSSAERDSWSYPADNQMHCGLKIPVHVPGGRFLYVRAGLRRLRRLVRRRRSVAESPVRHCPSLQSDRSREIRQSISALSHCDPFGSGVRVSNLGSKGKECAGYRLHHRPLGRDGARHLKHACSKLGATSRTHAAAKAVFLGLNECP
jgi:autoinducer binding domain-containing protein